MRAEEKMLLTTLAAREIGKSQIDYPVQHCLVFYLTKKAFKFPTYNFTPATWPDYGMGLLSRQLDRDIDMLVGRGMLKISGSPFISITDAGIKEAKPLVAKLEEEAEKYEELKSVVGEALRSDWHIFLETCYTLYIREEYLASRK